MTGLRLTDNAGQSDPGRSYAISGEQWAVAIGGAIRARREALLLRQGELADAAGVCGQRLCRIELAMSNQPGRGEAAGPPRMHTLARIAAALGCKPSEIVADAEARLAAGEP